MIKKALVIFVKNPILGEVKPKLAESLGKESALNVHLNLINYIAEITTNIEVDKFVFYSSSIPNEPKFPASDFKLHTQEGKDLGERMEHAYNYCFQKGYKQVVLVGTDCPELETKDIEHSFKLLITKDVIIGPSSKGGYYLLGLNEPLNSLFQDVPWHTDSVFKKTYLEALSHQKKIALLEEKTDIEVLPDLENSKFSNLIGQN
jgi:uncharacterized protein